MILRDRLMTNNLTSNADEETYAKIGGWLILCAIGLVLYPVQTAVSLYTEVIPALSAENWSRLTSPHSTAYHPLWAPLLIMEMVGNLCFLSLSVWVLVNFFKQRKFVPKLTISFLTANLIFVALDYYFIQRVLSLTNPGNMAPTINFVRTLVASIIWISYFLFSKRVKRTFIY
jgi:hypothetical protein